MKKFLKGLVAKIFSVLLSRFDYQRDLTLINTALSRGAATSGIRNIDPERPETWEFSAFSQNGEDGIIDYLLSKLKTSNRYFIEVGATAGLDGNCAWLSHGRRFSGLMIDGKESAIERGKKVAVFGTTLKAMFVDHENVSEIAQLATHKDPDVLSLDIDGNDYYIAEALLKAGLLPKIITVEYNSAYGPDAAITILYAAEFNLKKAHPTELYYGVSVTAWRKLFGKYGYDFVCVDSNGVNAFFIHRESYGGEKFKGLQFKENFYQYGKFKSGWNVQFSLIKEMPYLKV